MIDAVRRRRWCLGATHAHIHYTDTDVPAPARWWDANPWEYAPAAGPPNRAVCPGTRTGDTSHPVRPHGTRAPHGHSAHAGPSPPARADQRERTSSHQQDRRKAETRGSSGTRLKVGHSDSLPRSSFYPRSHASTPTLSIAKSHLRSGSYCQMFLVYLCI